MPTQEEHEQSLEATLKYGIVSQLDDHTADACIRFAMAMMRKLHAAQEKFGWGTTRPNYLTTDPDELRMQLREHMVKGDPVDVANYAMMLWDLKQPTSFAGRENADPQVPAPLYPFPRD